MKFNDFIFIIFAECRVQKRRQIQVRSDLISSGSRPEVLSSDLQDTAAGLLKPAALSPAALSRATLSRAALSLSALSPLFQIFRSCKGIVIVHNNTFLSKISIGLSKNYYITAFLSIFLAFSIDIYRSFLFLY